MNTEWDRLVDALAKVVQSPFQVIEQEVDHQWYFCIGRCPSESESDEEPPVRLDEYSDVIQIDGVLGLYTPETQEIMIFSRGIEGAV